jgi:hypothetical protein
VPNNFLSDFPIIPNIALFCFDENDQYIYQVFAAGAGFLAKPGGKTLFERGALLQAMATKRREDKNI